MLWLPRTSRWRAFGPDNTNAARLNYTRDMTFMTQLYLGVSAVLTKLGARIDVRAFMLDLLYEPEQARPAPFDADEMNPLGYPPDRRA